MFCKFQKGKQQLFYSILYSSTNKIKISLKLENIFQLKNLTNFGHIEIPISGM